MDSVEEKTFAVMSLHQFSLSLPQEEIVSLDVASAASSRITSDDGSIGELEYLDQILPVFSFSEDLGLVHERPKDQNICVCIAVAGKPLFCLTCASLKPAQLVLANVFPIPEPMAGDSSPLRGLVLINDSVVFTSTAEALQSYISLSGGRDD